MSAFRLATRWLNSVEASKTRFGVGAIVLIVAGVVIATPDAAVAVGCGDVIVKDTKLTSDLLNCPGDGLAIGAPKITLDLNGHSITGTGNGSGVSNGDGHAKVTIKNGSISGFELGVHLSGA